MHISIAPQDFVAIALAAPVAIAAVKGLGLTRTWSTLLSIATTIFVGICSDKDA